LPQPRNVDLPLRRYRRAHLGPTRRRRPRTCRRRVRECPFVV